ncbi:MAG TPA: NlpC/P60 family protein [Puia sp.]|jgi:lipoprotein Spr|nr:NlpC/P60 family protein [Puia sp.]
MKNRFILLLLVINLAGCNAFRPASHTTDSLSSGTADLPSSKNSQPVFIQNISTGSSVTKTTTGSAPYGTTGTSVKGSESHVYKANSSITTPISSENDAFSPLQFKFAILTNSPVEDLTNLRLLVFMDQWYGVPYHYGGSNKEGIDCSAFASLLLSSVYDVSQLPRISADQYHATRRVPKKDLREGDLVFFHTFGKGHRVTHVGVYLYNNRFVHASIAGVQISNLGEGYYLHHYVGAGRAVDSDRTY